MKHAIRHSSRALAMGVALGCLSLAALPGQAAEPDAQRHVYDIRAGALGATLTQLTAQSGVLLSFEPALTAGKYSQGLHGSYSLEQGLARLLENTGLQFETDGQGGYRLVPAPSGALLMQPTEVNAHRGAQSYQGPSSSSITRAETALRDIPQTINVVASQVLQDQKASSLDDALQNVSGIVQGNTVGSTQDSYMKRGFGTFDDGAILRDGIRSAQRRNFSATSERVEVLKGPASVLYGILEPGGVINVISKRPQRQQAISISAMSSSFGGGGGSFDITGPIADTDFSYRLIAEQEETDYWRNFGNSRHTLVAPSLGWSGEQASLDIAYEHRDFSYSLDRGTAVDKNGRIVDTPRRTRFDEDWNRNEGSSDFFSLRGSYDLSENWTGHATYAFSRELYSTAQIRRISLSDNGNLRRMPDATRGVGISSNYASVDVLGRLDWGGVEQQLLIGVDSELRRGHTSRYQRATAIDGFNIYNPVYGAVSMPGREWSNDALGDYQSRVLQQSVFLQDSIALDEQWNLVAGLRLQHYDQQNHRGISVRRNGLDNSGNNVLKSLGVVYKPNDDLSLYASYSESFRPNTTTPNSVTLDVANGFKPEEGESLELGARYDWKQRLSLTAALYQINKRNVLVTDQNGDPRAAGEVRSRGLEIDVSGQLSDRFDLIANYAYTDALNIKDEQAYEGNRLWNVARNSASAFLVYRLDGGPAFGAWRFGIGPRYVGERPGDSLNTFDLPAYTVVDAMASVDAPLLGNNTHLQVNVKNLFDKTYYTSSLDNLDVYIGAARQLVFSARIDF